MFVKFLGVLLAALVVWAIAAHSSTGAGKPQVYTVKPYDTLWSIATEHYPSDDVRIRVDDIERLNGLHSPRIEAGQTLRLPG